MKNVFGTILAALTITLMAVPSMATTKVFLLGGQSNMAGCGVTSDLQPPFNSSQPDVRFWNKCNTTGGWPPVNPGDAWVDLEGGFGHQFYPDLSMFGPEVSFGYALNELFPDDDIYLIKYGLTSQNLAVNWKPDGTGAVYNAFKLRVDTALANLVASGKSPVISGMIWMQGESDAMEHAYATEYQSNLTNFITQVRSDFSTPQLPFVIGRINTSAYWGTPADNALVRDAQVEVANQMANVSWINTDDIPTWKPGENPSDDHYSSQGQLILGTRFAYEFNPVPLPQVVLFEDNFDNATVGAFPDSPTVGTWSAVGTAAADVLVTDVDPPGPVSPSNYLSAYRSESTWTGADADFARQTCAADLIRIEFDYFATSASGSAGYVNFQDKGGAGDLQYFIPRWDGSVLSGGGNLSGLVLDEWNHWVIDYMPGAATCDVTISGTLNAGVGMYGASTGIDAVQFATTYVGTDLIRYDNVKVTLNPVDNTNIPGDANKDGKVDGSDVTILAGNWQYGADGNGSATWEMGDFNGDGKVDGSDVTILAGNWQHGVTVATTSVPEPSIIVLLLTAIAGLLLIRQR